MASTTRFLAQEREQEGDADGGNRWMGHKRIPPSCGAGRKTSSCWDPRRAITIRCFGSRSDVWFRSYVVPADTLMQYKLAPDVPQVDGVGHEQRRAILVSAQADR